MGENNKVQIDIVGQDASGSKVIGDTSAALQSLKRQTGELTGTVSTLSSVLGAGGLVYALSSAMDASVQTERAMVGLAVTARYSGAGMAEAQAAAQNLAKDGLMSVTEASQALQNLLSRGFTLEESVKMMNRLKDSAAFNRQAHLEFGQSIVGATEGLKNENSVLVDNAGVTKNVSVMWKEYAREHKKSVDDLTQSEKRHAEFNGIMRETEGQIGNAARMVNTYAGAQARLNQQLFESKSALGTGLQPVLKATMDMIVPIVKGFRDIVYWIETLGPRAGATIDKMVIAKDIALSGKGIFSKEGQAEFAARTAGIDKILEESIADIVRRSEGAVLPDVGADNGKRRKDIVVPPKDKKGHRDKIPGFPDYLMDEVREQEQLQRESLNKQGSAFKTYQTSLAAARTHFNEMGREGMLDLSKLTSSETEKQTNLQINALGIIEQTQLAIQQNKLKRSDDSIGMIELEYKAQLATLSDRYQQELFMAEDNELSRYLIEEKYRQLKLMSVEQYEEKIKNTKFQKQQETLAGAQTYTSATANLFSALYALSGNKLKAFFYIAQTANAAGAIMSGFRAGMAAVEPPPIGLGPVWGLPLKGLMIAGGFATAANIMSQTLGGGGSKSIGGLPGGPTMGSSGNPIITQPVSNNTGMIPSNITIHIEGNMLAEDRWVEERLAPIIKDLANRRNVDFGLATA